MAYDSSDKTVNAGLYGYMDVSAATMALWTYIDTSQPIQAAGTLSRVKFKVQGTADTASSSAKVAVLRVNGANYDIVGVVDVTSHFAAAATTAEYNNPQGTRFDWDSAETYGAVAPIDFSGITVAAGDLLAVYSASNIPFCTVTHTGFDVVRKAGDQLTGSTATAGYATVADTSFMCDVWITTNEPILLDDSSILTSDVILTPTFTDEIYTIILEDVVVPDAEDLKITLWERNETTQADREDDNIYFDMTQGAGAEVIALREYDDTVLDSQTITFAAAADGGADDKYTVIITIDPTAVYTDSIKVNYINYQNGQGPIEYSANSTDVSNVSITGGWWQDRRDSNPVKLITFAQGTGAAATIARVMVTRKNVVCVGDSFVSKHNTNASGTELSHVADELSDASRFSEDRYTVNGGITGSMQLLDSSTNASIAHRFDSVGSEIWDMPNSVCVFVNGPGINDIVGVLSKPTTNAEAIALGEALAWNVAAMASKAINNGSDVVLNECCYLETGHADKDAFTDLAVTTFNTTLIKVSYQLQAPIARTAAGILADAATYYSADHIHLETAGDEFMADAIVSAYENNTIAINPDVAGIFVQGG